MQMLQMLSTEMNLIKCLCPSLVTSYQHINGILHTMRAKRLQMGQFIKEWQ